MAKGSGTTRKSTSGNPTALANSVGGAVRTGPGWDKPVEGVTEPSSDQLEIRYYVVDKITGNEVSKGLKTLDAARKITPMIEKDDMDAGVYEKDSYKIIAREIKKKAF